MSEERPMARRHTAYVSTNNETPDGTGVVTVDLYVLWPEGQGTSLLDLLDHAVDEVRRQVKEAS
jgi:hypothetical protein